MKYKSKIEFHDLDIPTPVFFIHFKGVFRYFRYLLDPNLKYFYDFSFKLS